MINFQNILETITMIDREKLDIRTITMGISLLESAPEERSMIKLHVMPKIWSKSVKI